MKWISINNRRDSIHEYHLVNDGQLKMILKFNPETHSVRINSEESQRLFFIENAGSLTGKYLLKNEYGMEIGNLVTDKWSNGEGVITVESKKYSFSINQTDQPEFVIYEKAYGQPLTTCALSENNFTYLRAIGKSLNADTSCLLLGLCWYLLAPVKEKAYVA